MSQISVKPVLAGMYIQPNGNYVLALGVQQTTDLPNIIEFTVDMRLALKIISTLSLPVRAFEGASSGEDRTATEGERP